jgi:hypothetical protein
MILFSRLADAAYAAGDALLRIVGQSDAPRCRVCGHRIDEGELATHLNEVTSPLTGVRTVTVSYSHRERCSGRATFETHNSLPA